MFPAEEIDEGIFLLRDLVPRSVCRDLCERVLRMDVQGLVRHVDSSAKKHGVSGGRLKHGVIDGTLVRHHLPELLGVYYGLRMFLSAVTGRPIVTEVSERSDVNVLLYRGGSAKDPHFDTVPITFVLFLTTHESQDSAGAFCFQNSSQEVQVVRPRAGTGLLFEGRKVRHWVQGLNSEIERIVVNANYYPEGETARDPQIDHLLYES